LQCREEARVQERWGRSLEFLKKSCNGEKQEQESDEDQILFLHE
jgi:hypothetical protein